MIVHGVVVASQVGEDALGRPETVTVITPLEVLKGHVSGALVLHQLGGELPDGRFFKLWGRPEYEAGHEVVVFAIARAEGGYQTAELILGKFEVQQDEGGVRFAVPGLVADAPVQVTVMRQRSADGPDSLEAEAPDDALAPRELDGFLRSLRGDGAMPQDWAVPRGALTSSVYPEYRPEDVAPFFNIGGLWRWNNGADGRLDPGRSGQRHRRRNGGGDQRHGHVGRAAELDDRLHDRAGRRQSDPFERSVLSLRLEHVHGGRRRDRLRRAWREAARTPGAARPTRRSRTARSGCAPTARSISGIRSPRRRS